MPGFFTSKSAPSKDIARDRLKMILVTDRVDGSTHILELIKNDIVKVLKQYLVISADDVELEICQPNLSDGESTLPPRIKADIPFKNMRNRQPQQ